VDAAGAVLCSAASHPYEGHSAQTVVHGVHRGAGQCGVVVLTNAAGGLDPDVPVGTPVLLRDHLNLTGASPLTGDDPPARFGIRFCDLTEAYDAGLRALAHRVDADLPEGVYAGLLGGAYETPAEIRMLRTLGADLVGMSTVLETIAARHLDARVLGISLVTNFAAGISPDALAHAEVLQRVVAVFPYDRCSPASSTASSPRRARDPGLRHHPRRVGASGRRGLPLGRDHGRRSAPGEPRRVRHRDAW
jgi:purine-nucleoside phosphorylase